MIHVFFIFFHCTYCTLLASLSLRTSSPMLVAIACFSKRSDCQKCPPIRRVSILVSLQDFRYDSYNFSQLQWQIYANLVNLPVQQWHTHLHKSSKDIFSAGTCRTCAASSKDRPAMWSLPHLPVDDCPPNMTKILNLSWEVEHVWY